MARKYHVEYDFKGKKTYTTVGCEKCNNTGFYEELVYLKYQTLTENIKELIVKDASSIEIRNKAIEEGYKPLVIDGLTKLWKVIQHYRN